MFDVIRRKFASAPYAFFRVHNYEDARRQFLGGEVKEPRFTYAMAFHEKALQQRQQTLEQIAGEALDEQDESLSRFIGRRIEETELLIAFMQLKRHPKDAKRLETYRNLTASLYGEPDPAVLQGIFAYLHGRAKATSQTRLYKELASMVSVKPLRSALQAPSDETFAHYRKLLLGSKHPALDLPTTNPSMLSDRESLLDYFRQALVESGAAAQGWTVRDGKAGANIVVSRHKKRLVVGKHYRPQTELRLKQVVAHEVFVHIRRAMLHEGLQAGSEEEGTAIIMEQLLSHRFMYRRMLRYMAAALAWGSDGKRRTFSETFDIIWRASMIVSQCDEALAKERAFAECTRIFRGGLPQVAGAAFTKDKVYLETNLSLWRQLEDNTYDQETFLQLLDGHITLGPQS